VENEPCTLTSAGLCRWVSSNVRDERNAVLFSQPISLFLEGKDLRGAKLFHRKETGELYLLLENLLLVYQYAQKVFYRYQVPLVRSFCQGEKEFFFSTENGIYQVGGSCDDGEKIPAYWRSRALLIGEEEKRKDLHSVRLYARSPGEAAISVILHPEDREKEEKALFCDPEKEMWEAGFRSKVRSFRTLALEIRADGDEAVHLFGVTLRGKVTDGMGKE